ncbi:hypothetical protein N5853_02775 [Bartonella sp. HY329]|uniref:hypothetical protein n=1 Tax=unclassified Bartonella TaxID=2645622 RepID=UPI0021C954F3|nr:MULTISPECIES: hypothetical protein [unclassified Bartonella]UXM95573.1 hypothetical protein N5853_02775 [Bartonella sp. HY329]UXN09898.1 hypothetical protein N5852_02785 [Bartonella sp. HY328]
MEIDSIFYLGAGFYLVWAGLAILGFLLALVRPGWLTRIIALPLIALPFIYVFLYFSQNLPYGENDGWLTYFVRSHGDPDLLAKYNQIPKIITGFMIPGIEISNPLICWMALCLAVMFISITFPKLKFLSGTGTPSKGKVFKRLGLFLLVLAATFAYHIHQYDPLAELRFISPKTPIEQGSKEKKEYLYLSNISKNLGRLVDSDRTTAYFTRDIANNAREITVLDVGKLRYEQAQIYLAQKMAYNNPRIYNLVQEYIDTIVEFYPLAREMKNHATIKDNDDLTFIKENQQAYIDYLHKFKYLRREIGLALPPDFYNVTQNYRNSLDQDDKRQLYLAVVEDLLALTVLADKALKTSRYSDEVQQFKNNAEKMRNDYNLWRQSFDAARLQSYGNLHESMVHFYKRFADYIGMVKIYPPNEKNNLSLAIMRDGLLSSVNLINYKEYYWEDIAH